MANLFLFIGFYKSDKIVVDKFKNKYRIPSSRWQSWDYGSQGSYFITICTRFRKHYFGKIENEEMYLNELGLITHQEWLKSPTLRPDMNIELGEFVVMPNHFHGIITIGENQFNKMKIDHDCNDIDKIYKAGCIDPYDECRCCNGAMDGAGGNNRCCNANGGVDGNVGCRNRRDAMHGVSTKTTTTTTGISPMTDTYPPFEYPFSFPDPPPPGLCIPPEIWIPMSTHPANKFGPQSKNVGSIIRGFKSSVTTYARINNINFNWQDRFHDHVIRNAEEYFRISEYIKNNPKKWKGDRFNKSK